ncbi:hypothetical protein [Xanthomonas fragariae]|uniref:hypothetical protein n=1 Tax=Xanthomonas fragariae TaxID=48664 RepID=UPI00131F3461|nr:hypothetical protein [Xanthomonas fragariae]
MAPAQVFDRHACFGFAQEANDLLFGKALLHVQSPRGRELVAPEKPQPPNDRKALMSAPACQNYQCSLR